MSLSGYLNNGLNQSLNGIFSITDGSGVVIENGSITADSININTIDANYITGELETSTQPNITSVGTLLNLNVSGNSVLSGLLTIGNGIYTGTNTVSNSVLNFISTLTSDCQTQLNNLSNLITSNSNSININTVNIATNTANIATNTTNILSNSTDISSILSRITAITYNSSLLTTTIANILQLTSLNVSGNTSLSGTLNSGSITIASNNNINLSGSGIISQSSSGTNTLSNTQITGQLSQIGNIVQTSGSNTLLASTIGTITQSGSNIITQSGSGTNNLKNTTISNLTVSSSMSFPSNTTIPGASYSGNTAYTGTAIISQSGSGSNLLKNTEFTGTVQFDSSITQSSGGSVSLQSTSITGQLNQAGNIVQSTGSNTFLVSSFSGLITTNGGINIPSGQLLTLLGNLYVNSITITPLVLSYIANLTGDLETSLTTINTNITNIENAITAISYNSSTLTTTILSTLTSASVFNCQTINISGTCTVGSSGNITLLGNILANSQTITPTKIGYISNLTSDIQSQINSILSTLTNYSYSGGATYISQSIYLTTVNISSALNIGSSSQIVANSQIVSPAQIGYLSSVTSDIQNQINSLPTSSSVSSLTNKCTNISYSSPVTTISGTTNLSTVSISTLLTLNGNISSNSLTVTPSQIGYLANLTSDVNTSLTTINSNITTLQTKTTNISFSGSTTTISNTLQTTGTSNLGAVVFKSSVSLNSGNTFTISGNLSANSKTITPIILGYISNLSSDCQTQITNANTNITTLQTTLTNLSYSSGTTTISGLLSLSGSGLYVNSTTISPTILSYLSGCSSNIQTQISNLSSSITTTNTNVSNIQTTLTNISYSSGTTQISCGSFGSLYLSSNSYPTTTSSNAGLIIYWNAVVPGNGQTDFLNYGQGGSGGFTFNSCNISNSPSKILNIDGSGNVTPSGDIILGSSKYIDLTACIASSSGLKLTSSTYLNATQLSNLSGFSSVPISYSSPTTTINSNLQVNGLYETSTSALTYTSTSIGYVTSVTSASTTALTSGVFSYSSSLSLGIGVWLISGVVQIYSTITAVITKYIQISYTSGGQIINGTQFSTNHQHVANSDYASSTGCTPIVVTSVGTQIRLAIQVSNTNCYYDYYYLSATKIG